MYLISRSPNNFFSHYNIMMHKSLSVLDIAILNAFSVENELNENWFN